MEDQHQLLEPQTQVVAEVVDHTEWLAPQEDQEL
jgi:hypothetical protein